MRLFLNRIRRAGLLLAFMLTAKVSAEPLNVRNLNPCNIKKSERNNWKGSLNPKGAFEVFGTKVMGIRACTIVVMANIHATTSVSKFVKRFASEPNESMTEKHLRNYARHLEKVLGYKGKIDYLDTPKVVKAIIKLEGGAEASEFYSNDLIGQQGK